MRLVGSTNSDKAVIAYSSTLSNRMNKLYSLAMEIANSDASNIKTVIENFQRKLYVENREPGELQSETLYRLFGEAAIGNSKAKQAIKTAFITDILDEYKNDPIKAENMANLYDTLFDNLFETIKLETANVTGQFIPYTMYAAPLLRFMIPKLIATDLFTISPMKGPVARLYFLKYYQEDGTTPYPFAAFLEKQNNQLVPGESLTQYGTQPGGNLTLQFTGNTITVNLVSELKNANLIPPTVDNAPIQRGSFTVVSIVVQGQAQPVPVTGTVDPTTGIFYFSDATGLSVSGQINYANGQVTISRNDAAVTGVVISARIAYEYRNPARKVRLRADEYDLKEQRIEETILMSPEFLHDVKMLFDVDLQSEIVAILSSLIALNTDAFLLMHLYNTAVNINPPYLSETVQANPPQNVVFPTPKIWYEGTFIPAIFRLEGKLRKETPSYDVEPVLVMNTIDAQYVRSTDKYSADVSDMSSVLLARRVNGTLDNVMKIVTTPILPEGVNLMILKSNNPLFATAVYAPYVTQIIPYPASTIGPAMTAVHRFAVVIPWTKSIGIFNVVQ